MKTGTLPLGECPLTSVSSPHSSFRSLCQYLVPETSALAIRPFFVRTKTAMPLWNVVLAAAPALPAAAPAVVDCPHGTPRDELSEAIARAGSYFDA